MGVSRRGSARHSRAEFLIGCEAWLDEALASRRWIIAVAETESRSLCGCIFLQCVDKVPEPGGVQRAWGYVTNSYVVSQQRGQGVGRQLLDLLLGEARVRRLEFLIVWPSRGAVSFYRRAGFRPVSEAHAAGDDEPPLELALS